MIGATSPTSCPRDASKLLLPWHTDPNSGERTLLPALTPAQVRHLFNLAEQDHRRHPEYTKTLIDYRGRPFGWSCESAPCTVTYKLHEKRPARKITTCSCDI